MGWEFSQLVWSVEWKCEAKRFLVEDAVEYIRFPGRVVEMEVRRIACHAIGRDGGGKP
jgi:hypothetical protein